PRASRSDRRRRPLVRRALASAMAGLVVAGCTVGPNYQRPESTPPAEVRGLGPANPPGPTPLRQPPRWEVFPDPVLQDLIREALRQNYNLQVTAARILEARAQVTIARSFQFPELNSSGSATYSQIVGKVEPPQVEKLFPPSAGLDVTWEIDF